MPEEYYVGRVKEVYASEAYLQFIGLPLRGSYARNVFHKNIQRYLEDLH